MQQAEILDFVGHPRIHVAEQIRELVRHDDAVRSIRGSFLDKRVDRHVLVKAVSVNVDIRPRHSPPLRCF